MKSPFLRSALLLAMAAASLLAFGPELRLAPSQQGESGGAAAVGQADSQSLVATADALLGEMSQMTGLPIRAPLKKQVVSRPEIQKYLVENLQAEYTPQELHVQQATLEAFGLVSPDFDLEKFLITFYTEQAAGFYDPRRKIMFLADWVDKDTQTQVLAHELTHALQDQSFDLLEFLHADRANDDATNARQAVVEGYATAAMMQRLIHPMKLTDLPSLSPLMDQVVHMQMSEFPAFTSAPFFFRLQAMFPYTQGMGFIQRGLEQGGWQKLGTLFANPPATTKEIFEPGFYFEHRPLPRLTLPHPAPLSNLGGLRLLAENVMGELGYYALLGQFISEDDAKSVATGWAADRYILYEQNDNGKSPRQGTAAHRYTLVARTRWSSPEKAQAFFHDYQTILGRKYPGLGQDKRPEPDSFLGSGGSGEVILLRKGDEVRWAEGVPTTEQDATLDWLRSL
jgi:hypothetical protein